MVLWNLYIGNNYIKKCFTTLQWLTNELDFLFSLDGYNEFNQYRNSHGGGIKIYIRDSLKVNFLDEYCLTSNLYESLVGEIIISGIKFVICCIYKPPTLI